MSEEKEVKVRASKKKNDIYKKEQEKVVERLNEILGIDESNNKFILEELKRDEERQRKIIELEEEIKRVFVYHDWPYFKGIVENKWLSLLRSIYKNTNYELSYRQTTKGGEKNIIYIINKKNNDI